MGGFNLQSLMSQAKQQYENLQKKMQETVVEATAGGGTVHVKMDGRKQLLSLKINPEAVQKKSDSHWGLRGMRDRAENIGARFEIRSRSATGTEVRIVVPMDLAGH